ncbi:unnamed protein product [Auanema sp. JU1783]|nr:unnamed protein product [Auanema sp. JU1783]
MVDRLVHSEVNSRRVVNVEQCFGKGSMTLNTYGRVLVGEGILVKMCRKKPKQRQFFLFNDILVYGNIVISKKRYNKQRVIPLDSVTLEDLLDEGTLKNGWVIKTPSKSFAVYAATATEKKEWMLHIKRCVDVIKSKEDSKEVQLAPVWVPDNVATKCMCCKRKEFNLVSRRHHCRACGDVVCGGCSTHSLKIDTVNKNNPVRVCDKCFDSKTRPKNTNSDGKTAKENKEEGSDSSDDEVELDKPISKPTFYNG